MRVLVTGGAGFLGRAVVGLFERQGYEVIAPRSKDYDLRRQGAVGRLLNDAGPEVVVHLAAAVGGLAANISSPGRFLYENAVMGLELMEQSRSYGVRKFVGVGTACMYPDDAPIPLREDTVWDGYPAPATAPYGIAKRLLMAQGQAYRDQVGFDAIFLIPTNLYGPGDNFDLVTAHVVPALVRRFSQAAWQGEPRVELLGSGTDTREFLFVDDAAEAIVAAAQQYDGRDPVNIGTGVETPIAELADMIATAYGFEGEVVWNESLAGGTTRRCLDVSRAAELFGFRATTPLDEGLAETIAWYEGA